MALTTLTKIGKGITSLFKAKGATHARALEDRFSDTVNALDFGVTGDFNYGTGEGTDNTQFIINADEYAYNNNKRLVFPSGSFLFSESITLKTNSIKGAGQATASSGQIGDEPATVFVTKGNNHIRISGRFKDISSLTVRNMLPNDDSAGFLLEGVTYSTFSLISSIGAKRGIELRTYNAQGLVAGNYSNRFYKTFCIGNKYGFYTGGNQVNANAFEGCVVSGGNWTEDWMWKSNDINNPSYAFYCDARQNRGSRFIDSSIRFTSNSFKDCDFERMTVGGNFVFKTSDYDLDEQGIQVFQMINISIKDMYCEYNKSQVDINLGRNGQMFGCSFSNFKMVTDTTDASEETGNKHAIRILGRYVKGTGGSVMGCNIDAKTIKHTSFPLHAESSQIYRKIDLRGLGYCIDNQEISIGERLIIPFTFNNGQPMTSAGSYLVTPLAPFILPAFFNYRILSISASSSVEVYNANDIRVFTENTLVTSRPTSSTDDTLIEDTSINPAIHIGNTLYQDLNNGVTMERTNSTSMMHPYGLLQRVGYTTVHNSSRNIPLPFSGVSISSAAAINQPSVSGQLVVEIWNDK